MTPDNMALHLDAPDYAAMTPGELLAYALGRRHGWSQCEAERDRLEWENAGPAARAVVRNHAAAPARDHAADWVQAERRAAWWAERRGEVAA